MVSGMIPQVHNQPLKRLVTIFLRSPDMCLESQRLIGIIAKDHFAKLPTREHFTNYTKSLKELDKQKKPTMELPSVNTSAAGLVRIIDTANRPANVYAEDKYVRSGTYLMGGTNKPGKRIPKAGVYAEAGVGRAGAELSIFEAKAKGPNVSAGAEASALGASAMARAELGSASASAGPFTVKLGLGVDTGVSAALDGFEVKFLGTGFSIGSKTSISFLGSELSF
ncbi:uncharacterized protein LOC143934818 [Lithobates pipiens]